MVCTSVCKTFWVPFTLDVCVREREREIVRASWGLQSYTRQKFQNMVLSQKWFFVMQNGYWQVSVPCSSLFNMVTVRCGHCANLLSVNMGATVQAAPPQDPQVYMLSNSFGIVFLGNCFIYLFILLLSHSTGLENYDLTLHLKENVPVDLELLLQIAIGDYILFSLPKY